MASDRRSNPHWCQFRLPTVILLTALIAMAIAWWRDHRDQQQRLQEAQRQIQFLKTSPFVDGPAAPPHSGVR